MTASLIICFGIIGFIILIALVWRFSSYRRSLPCPTWLGWLVELDNPFTKTNRANVIIQRLDLQSGMSVLDVGCGPGRLTIPVAKQIGPEGDVVAVDIQAGMLPQAEEKARTANLHNIRFIHAGVGEGKLEPNHFDRALLVTVLGEIPDQEAAMKEIYDALKPGGILSVTEIIFDPHYQRLVTIRGKATAAGFKENNYFGNIFAFTINLEKSSTN
jgi:ubiquinone/menaquinone biosynthesis C-methylase UbiE